MDVFERKYKHLTDSWSLGEDDDEPEEDEEPSSMYHPTGPVYEGRGDDMDAGQTQWWIDDHGLLSLRADDGDDRCGLNVLRQVLDTANEGLGGKREVVSLLGGEGGNDYDSDGDE
ncbi:Uu.00g082950.m01.CDS01 [Anthostomella pinea]|uniref:Uu.00g082950.m01.CDS01 n=1 Tax=Anthostomella pinea TaxID=933095 RepID=A0AAI8YH58_9PEZI|nr:Uu.00g082950.m01.CDS01 [Anthostomella pinea]